MAKIIPFVRPQKLRRSLAACLPKAREGLADAAFVGRRLAMPAIWGAVIAAICSAPASVTLPLAGIGLTLLMGMVFDACCPLAVAGRLQRRFGGQ